MIEQTYAQKPMNAELTAISLPEMSRSLLTKSYAWIDQPNTRSPIESLVSPVGLNERALYRFVDNARANNHQLDQFMGTRLIQEDDDQQLTATLYEQKTPTEGVHRLLGAYLLQFSQSDGLFLPFLDALTIADVDAIGVMVLMLEQAKKEGIAAKPNLVTDLTEQMASFLAHTMRGQIRVLDHQPTEDDLTLPAYLLIPIETATGEEFDVPVALIDWLQDNVETLLTLPDEHREPLLDLMAQNEDGNGVVINEWLRRDEANETVFIEFIDSQLDRLRA